MNFIHHYHAIFNQSPTNTLLTFLNAFIPLRWIPIELNRKHQQAVLDIRAMLRDVYRKRVIDMAATKGQHISDRGTNTDVLTFMIQAIQSGEAQWTEEEIVDHVSSAPRCSASTWTHSPPSWFSLSPLATRHQPQLLSSSVPCLRPEPTGKLGFETKYVPRSKNSRILMP